MNFNIGGPSFINYSSSSSSSSDSSEFDEWLLNENEAIERDEQIAVNLLANNNRLAHQLIQEENHVSHRGSIHGMPADATDEYIKIGESTAIECLKRFCRAITEIFSEWYLRSPTPEDVARLLNIGHNEDFREC